jgi:hypothetical protein
LNFKTLNGYQKSAAEFQIAVLENKASETRPQEGEWERT